VFLTKTLEQNDGSSAYGMGNQQLDDAKKHGIESLNNIEPKWAFYLGRLVFENCKKSLARPMRLLSVFEAAGDNAEREGKFLEWVVPSTKFKVSQYYVEGQIKKVWVQYGPPTGEPLSTKHYKNTFQCSVMFRELQQYAKGRQSLGAAPNVIHSLDAAHLMLTLDKCDFPVTTIHDSFGALFADMPQLFVALRETFVDMYTESPLQSIMKDIGGNIDGIEIGTLDIKQVLESEYCFA
jgi:DNA-directed RNA polymerase